MKNNANQMIVKLPVLTNNDVVDMIRGLTVFTDAFIEHHQTQIQQQLRSEQTSGAFRKQGRLRVFLIGRGVALAERK